MRLVVHYFLVRHLNIRLQVWHGHRMVQIFAVGSYNTIRLCDSAGVRIRKRKKNETFKRLSDG